MGRLAHDQLAPPAQHPHRLPLDQHLVGERVVGVDGLQPPLGLGHDLLGDDHDVAGAQLRPLGDQVGEDVAGTDLSQPGDGDEGDRPGVLAHRCANRSL